MTAVQPAIVCPVCGRDDWTVALSALTDRQYGIPGEFELSTCDRCGLGRTNPFPLDSSRYYPTTYGPHAAMEGLGPRRPWHPLACRMSFSGNRLVRSVGRNRIGGNEAVRMMWGYLKRPPTSVLDYGCGSGRFLARMRQVGIRANGVDVSPRAIEVARSYGLDACVGSYDEMPKDLGEFGLVRLWHVLEHVADPVAALTELKLRIMPGGSIVVAVPNRGSALFEAFRSDWFQLDVPRHLWHFDPKSLSLAFDAAGLVVDRVIFSGDGASIMECIRYMLEANGSRLDIDGITYSAAAGGMDRLATAWNEMGVGDSIVMLGHPRS